MTIAENTNRARAGCAPVVLQAGLLRPLGEPAVPPTTCNFRGFVRMAKGSSLFPPLVEEPVKSLVAAAALAISIRLQCRSPPSFSERASLHSLPDFSGFGAIRKAFAVQIGRPFHDL
ncbi:hypothetical protein M514_24676 [Trichuris suis]|uniref:Uncharacterized protein n=1 Tax=Trichuris suis TaxID=68888 RepID=A0A085N155_9BILA|nr:hypothetical protein M514_24676 [Trichuris suis]